MLISRDGWTDAARTVRAHSSLGGTHENHAGGIQNRHLPPLAEDNAKRDARLAERARAMLLAILGVIAFAVANLKLALTGRMSCAR